MHNLTDDFANIFSDYLIQHSPAGQGLLSLVKPENFPDTKITIQDLSSGKSLLHKITLTKADNDPFTLLNIYHPPSIDKLPSTTVVEIERSCAVAGDFNAYRNSSHCGTERYSQLDSLGPMGCFLGDCNTFMCQGKLGDEAGPDHVFIHHDCEILFQLESFDPGQMKFLQGTSSYHLPLIFKSCTFESENFDSTYSEKSFDYSRISDLELQNYYSTLPPTSSLHDFKYLWDIMIRRCYIKDANRLESHFFNKFIKNSPDENSYNQLIEEYCLKHSSFQATGKIFKLISFLKTAKENVQKATRINTQEMSFKSQKSAFFEFKSRVESVEPLSKTKKRQFYRTLKWFWRNFNNYSKKNMHQLFTISELDLVLAKLNKTAVDYDYFPYRFFPKDPQVKNLFLHAVNQHIFKDEILDDKFKISKISFIKKPDGSFRPISNITRLAAIVESLIANRLASVILSSGKFKNSHGFIQGRSTETLFNDFFNSFAGSYGRNLVIIFYLIRWLPHRTSRWHQFWARPKRSFGQGSPLSVYLFVVFFDFTSDGLESVFLALFFADDSNFAVYGTSWLQVESSLARLLKQFVQWSKENLMKVNETKTKILFFHRNSTCSDPTLASFVTPTCRMLGVVLDNRLSFSSHISYLAKWVNSRVYALKALRELGVREGVLLRVVLSYRVRIIYGTWWFFTISKTSENTMNTLWLKLLKATLGFTKCVNSETVFSFTGTNNIFTYLTYWFTVRATEYSAMGLTDIFSISKNIEESLISSSRCRKSTTDQTLETRLKCESYLPFKVIIWRRKIEKWREIANEAFGRGTDYKFYLRKLMLNTVLHKNTMVKTEVSRINELAKSKFCAD